MTFFSLLVVLVAEAVKVLPACEKWAEIGVLGLAGRVLYRVGRRAGRQGEFCLAESQMRLA